jgi:hypothetical protein
MAVERSDDGLAEAPRGSRAVYSNVQASHPFAVNAADGMDPAAHPRAHVPLHTPDAQTLSPSVKPARSDRNDRAFGQGDFFNRDDCDNDADLLDDDLVREISPVKPSAKGGMSTRTTSALATKFLHCCYDLKLILSFYSRANPSRCSQRCQ